MLARVRNDNLCASPCGSTESISARAVGRLTRSHRRGSWRGRHSMRRQRKAGGPMTRRTTGMPMSHGAGIRRGRCKHAQSKRTASAKTIAQPAHRTRKYTTKTHLDTQRRRGKEPYARSRVQLVAWESCGACVDGAWGFSRLRQTVHTFKNKVRALHKLHESWKILYFFGFLVG